MRSEKCEKSNDLFMCSGNEPTLDVVNSDVVSSLLPTWTPQAITPVGIGA